MGNGSSSPSYAPLQEEGKRGDSRIVLFGSESPKYGATAISPCALKRQDQAHDVHSIQKPDERKPVPVENDGREDQNKLVLANGKSPYIIGTATTTSKRPLRYIICRVASGFAVCVLLLVFISLLISSLLTHPKYTQKSTIQGSTVVHLYDVNPFWYDIVDVSKEKSDSFDADIGLIECNKLVYNAMTHSGDHHGRTATSDTYQQLLHLEQYAYLVEGSWIHLEVNITKPPTLSNANISLLYFTNYNEYYKLANPNTAGRAHYDYSQQLNYTTVNHFSRNITGSCFNFLALKTPNGTDFTYNFTIHQVLYNDSDVNYQCSVGAVQRVCSLSLNVTGSISGSKYCLMERCTTSNENPDPFYSLDINIHCRYFNWVTCSLISITASLLLLLFAIGTYDVMRRRIFPFGKRSVSRKLTARK